MDKTLDILKTEAEIANQMTETAKRNAAANKYRREARWFPVVGAKAFVSAVIGLPKFLY
ncbi:MAG: hypothetical protein ACRYHA_34370 [Janthinobacterium lividum]